MVKPSQKTSYKPFTEPELKSIRADFPILGRLINGHPLVYLDSAATSQKPRLVIEAITNYYTTYNANVHRGVHTLSSEATDLFEAARARVADFISAPKEGVIFLRNATEALNLVASSFARELLDKGDRILTTPLEHHSNLVPWQLAAQRAQLELAFIPLFPDGSLDLSTLDQLLSPPTRLLTITHQSNALGTILPIRKIIAAAHAQQVLVCVDAVQSVPNMPISIADLGCDFLAFSGHKMGGPMGSGVLYGRPDLLDQMPPFLGGGSMIRQVDLQQSSYATIPQKFEAGTPDVAAALGLSAACDFLDNLGMSRVHAQEQVLTQYLLERLSDFPNLTLYGPTDLASHGGAVSFNLAGIHAHDVGTILDRAGVAIRAGHHCCQPLMHHLGVDATARASVTYFNTKSEIDILCQSLHEAERIFA